MSECPMTARKMVGLISVILLNLILVFGFGPRSITLAANSEPFILNEAIHGSDDAGRPAIWPNATSVEALGESGYTWQPDLLSPKLRLHHSPAYTPVISAAKLDTITDDDLNGRAGLGDTVTYTIVLSNGGDLSALNLTVSDLPDANTGLISGTLNVSPLAVDDTYTTAANTELIVADAPGSATMVITSITLITANDVEFLGDAFTISSVDTASLQGGVITNTAGGGFSYLPPLNFSGVDTFTYALQDSQGLTGQGLVTVTVINSKISGTKWHDLNKNGLRDAGEPGLADWTIYLDADKNGRLDTGELTTTTGINGEYAFNFLRPGTYVVAEQQQSCWRQTYPGTTNAGSGTAGNILVSTNDQISVYTRTGSLVSGPIDAPAADDDGRDLIVGQSDMIHLYNGTFSPLMSSYDPGTASWDNRTYPGWSTFNNISYGGIAFFQDYVFVTDMVTAGAGSPQGIVRFDLNNNSALRFADTVEFIDLTIGLDGLLYALDRAGSGSGDTVYVYDPLTRALLGTVNLAVPARGMAVSQGGDIFVAAWDGNIYHFDCDGSQLNFIDSGIENLTDIDISYDGQLVAGSWLGDVILADTSLGAVASFDSGLYENFVAFSDQQQPDTTTNTNHTLYLAAGETVIADFGSDAP